MSPTLVSLWTQVRRQLEEAGVESPVMDARLLVEAGAGVSRLDIITDPRRAVGEAQVEAVAALAARRAGREPMGYILGRKHFWTLDLMVGPDVLIPRPETEMLVEAALRRLPTDRPARVLDLGTGSGAILLAVLAERPLATGLGVDSSTGALAIAVANAAALALESRAAFQLGDWATGLEGRFDLALSNPPYIATGALPSLAAELSFEPRAALDGGEDGLAAYRAMIPSLPALLAPGGGFALEVGQGQAEAVASSARAAGLRVAPHLHDFNGIARVVAGAAQG